MNTILMGKTEKNRIILVLLVVVAVTGSTFVNTFNGISLTTAILSILLVLITKKAMEYGKTKIEKGMILFMAVVAAVIGLGILYM